MTKSYRGISRSELGEIAARLKGKIAEARAEALKWMSKTLRMTP
jgi:hypothetical protein